MFRRLLFGLFFSILATPALAEEKKVITLRWHGHSWWTLTTSAGTRITFNPHGLTEYGRPEVEADVLLVSHAFDLFIHKDQLVNGDKVKVIQGVVAGKGKKSDNWVEVDEKFKDVRIRNVGKIGIYRDMDDGEKRGKNSIFIVEADGLRFVHLGELGHELTEEQAKAIGPVDVLMIPIGGIYTINGEKAKKVVEVLKPRMYILPMRYATNVFPYLLDETEFIDGMKNVQRLKDTNTLTIPVGLKLDAPRIVLLNWAGK